MTAFDATLSTLRMYRRYIPYFNNDPSDGDMTLGPLPYLRVLTPAASIEGHAIEFRPGTGAEFPLSGKVTNLVHQAAAEAARNLIPLVAALSAAPYAQSESRIGDNRLALVVPPAGLVHTGLDFYLSGSRNDSLAYFSALVGWTEPASLPQQGPAGAEIVPLPDGRATADDSPAPAPEAAGLLTHVMDFGRAALERAIQDLTEPEGYADFSGTAGLYWLSLSSWLLGGAIAYEVLRRRNALPAPGLAGIGLAGEPQLFMEDLL
jgi:hypothetical protein